MDCQICFLPYNTSARKPKNLPCGHTYCTECLKKLLDQSTSTIKCPKDQTECKVPNNKIEELATCFALMDLLAADCLDCHKKPQDGPCFPEHCSKILCPDCKTSHRQKFSAQLVAELQAMKKQVFEQQAMCDDDSDLTRMIDQSRTVIAEVTRVFDTEKEKMIDAIKKKQEISSSSYFQWKKNFNLSLAQGRSFMDKVLSEIQQEGGIQTGKFLSDLKKQITQEKETISNVEQTKNQLPLFDASEMQQVFDRMMPALYESVMPTQLPYAYIHDYTGVEFNESYGKHGSGAGEFNGPWGIASSPVTGDIAVSDEHNHRIHILTADLHLVRVFGTAGSGQNQFKQPRGVCFSSSGSLFIADNSNHRIKQVSEEGAHIRTFGSEGSGTGQFDYPQGISWERGLLYVCDGSNYRVQVMKESGEHVRSIVSWGPSPEQFTNWPFCIAVSGQHDQLVVTDNSGYLYFFSLDGQPKKTIKAGHSPCNIVAGDVMIDELGQVVVSDYEEGCLVVLGENKVIATIGLPAGERIGNPRGVTMTSDGGIIACDWDKGHIHKFTVLQHKQTNTCAY